MRPSSARESRQRARRGAHRARLAPTVRPLSPGRQTASAARDQVHDQQDGQRNPDQPRESVSSFVRHIRSQCTARAGAIAATASTHAAPAIRDAKTRPQRPQVDALRQLIGPVTRSKAGGRRPGGRAAEHHLVAGVKLVAVSGAEASRVVSHRTPARDLRCRRAVRRRRDRVGHAPVSAAHGTNRHAECAARAQDGAERACVCQR